MTNPIVELIAQDIEARINEITTGNGFNQNLVALRPMRVDFKDVAPTNGYVLIKQADEEEPEDQAHMTKEWEQPFVLMAIVLQSDTASTSIDQKLNQVRADIQKKLTEDTTRGGNAIDTVILPSAEFDDGEGFTGIAVRVVVRYRVKINDPYTKT